MSPIQSNYTTIFTRNDSRMHDLKLKATNRKIGNKVKEHISYSLTLRQLCSYKIHLEYQKHACNFKIIKRKCGCPPSFSFLWWWRWISPHPLLHPCILLVEAAHHELMIDLELFHQRLQGGILSLARSGSLSVRSSTSAV